MLQAMQPWLKSAWRCSARAWHARKRHQTMHTAAEAGTSSEGAPTQAEVARALKQAITSDVCNMLARQGYAVVDGLFGSAQAAALRQEVVRLYEEGLMHKNCTHLVKDNVTQLLEKSHIHEAELTLDERTQEAAPLCAALNADRSMATLLSTMVPPLTLDSQAIKLQYNAGEGGCFPIHFDSDELLDGRRVTAIFYLNPDWQPHHGGHLRLYPFPAPPVDIEPRHDRLALFASTRMAHRVMPAHVPGRCCFTIWLSNSRRRTAGIQQPPSLSQLQPPEAGADVATTVRFLMSPHVRKHVCKLAYAQEWEQSLEQSHPAGPARESALEQHRAEIGVIRRALARYVPLIEQLSKASSTLATSGPAGLTPQDIHLLRQTAAEVHWF